jgi:hypothetical protein
MSVINYAKWDQMAATISNTSSEGSGDEGNNREPFRVINDDYEFRMCDLKHHRHDNAEKYMALKNPATRKKKESKKASKKEQPKPVKVDSPVFKAGFDSDDESKPQSGSKTPEKSPVEVHLSDEVKKSFMQSLMNNVKDKGESVEFHRVQVREEELNEAFKKINDLPQFRDINEWIKQLHGNSGEEAAKIIERLHIDAQDFLREKQKDEKSEEKKQQSFKSPPPLPKPKGSKELRRRDPNYQIRPQDLPMIVGYSPYVNKLDILPDFAYKTPAADTHAGIQRVFQQVKDSFPDEEWPNHFYHTDDSEDEDLEFM